MFKIRFKSKETIEVELEQELSLLSAANRGQAGLNHRCGGHARCGTCKVRIVEGSEHLSEMGASEKRILGILKAAPEERLACQCWAKGEVTVEVP